ncbi:MAG: 3-isopropylmalate dehydratase small subunit [Candidatus Caenarcaniphilales bacterium]|nr:3-isopropylmalate dehydratase small subunit [Candidatus Caenarcaniphilales bacterium]
MSLNKITKVQGTAVYVSGDDIDTDRIIPARFMKCVTFDGLGQYAFYDVRFDENGNSKDHPMDKAEHKEATILISGKNFGCGSSREHAPQSLYHWGIRAIIAESYAEIFFGNCTMLGIPCITLSKEQIEKIAVLIQKNPSLNLEIDLMTNKLFLDTESIEFQIPESSKLSLMEGRWDSLGELLDGKDAIKLTAKKLESAY